MLATTLLIAKLVLAISAALCLARLIKGPHLVDRLLAQDTLMTHIIAILMIYSIEATSMVLLVAALLIALFSFISTVAAAKYIEQEQIID